MKVLQSLRALKRVQTPQWGNMSSANRIINKITGDSYSMNKTKKVNSEEIMAAQKKNFEVGNVFNDPSGMPMGGANIKFRLMGYTKTGALVAACPMGYDGDEGTGYFIIGNPNSQGRRISSRNLDKVVVQKVNPQYWKEWERSPDWWTYM